MVVPNTLMVLGRYMEAVDSIGAKTRENNTFGEENHIERDGKVSMHIYMRYVAGYISGGIAILLCLLATPSLKDLLFDLVGSITRLKNVRNPIQR